MKTERPILFSGAMVRALLDGRKTQTWRVVKWPLCSQSDGSKKRILFERDVKLLQEILKGPFQSPLTRFCPYGKPGDRLWVRETTCIAPKRWATPDDTCRTDYDGDKRYVAYKADGHSEDAMRDYKLNWTPSIHVPRWASRIDLEITGVRVERLQDISEADACREGCSPAACGGCGARVESSRCIGCMHPFWKAGFQSLWDSINGKPQPNKPDVSWAANPWVWVVEFKRVEGRGA